MKLVKKFENRLSYTVSESLKGLKVTWRIIDFRKLLIRDNHAVALSK